MRAPSWRASAFRCPARPGVQRPFEPATWDAPLRDVGTDTREYDVLTWRADCGVLTGARLPLIGASPLRAEGACSINILSNAVVGSIIQSFVPVLAAAPPGLADAGLRRVPNGIWVAAPYLHDGAVPSLAALLKKPSDRGTAFEVGPDCDIATVGLAEAETASTAP